MNLIGFSYFSDLVLYWRLMFYLAPLASKYRPGADLPHILSRDCQLHRSHIHYCNGVLPDEHKRNGSELCDDDWKIRSCNRNEYNWTTLVFVL